MPSALPVALSGQPKLQPPNVIVAPLVTVDELYPVFEGVIVS
jgi:hypothetical protein